MKDREDTVEGRSLDGRAIARALQVTALVVVVAMVLLLVGLSRRQRGDGDQAARLGPAVSVVPGATRSTDGAPRSTSSTTRPGSSTTEAAATTTTPPSTTRSTSTTRPPTTAAPTTRAPTIRPPTTRPPTTAPPTTRPPTTAAPPATPVRADLTSCGRRGGVVVATGTAAGARPPERGYRVTVAVLGPDGRSFGQAATLAGVGADGGPSSWRVEIGLNADITGTGARCRVTDVRLVPR